MVTVKISCTSCECETASASFLSLLYSINLLLIKKMYHILSSARVCDNFLMSVQEKKNHYIKTHFKDKK